MLDATSKFQIKAFIKINLSKKKIAIQPRWCWDCNFLWDRCYYNVYWCPGPLLCQGISSHGTNCIKNIFCTEGFTIMGTHYFKLCLCAALYEITCSQWMDEGIDWPCEKLLLCLLMLWPLKLLRTGRQQTRYWPHTVRCPYNTANFIKCIHKDTSYDKNKNSSSASSVILAKGFSGVEVCCG